MQIKFFRKVGQSLIIGFCLVTASAWAGVARGPVRIDGDAAFVAANGVLNPSAAGTEADPYLISGWDVSAAGSGACFEVRNTTRHFHIASSSCSQAEMGVSLERLAHAKLSNLTISGLSGKAGSYAAGNGGNAYGIRLAHVTDVSLTGSNYIGKLYGGAGAAGSNGGVGGVAQAVSVSGDNVALSFANVVIEYIHGGAGAAAIASGGAGGFGGSAWAVQGAGSTNGLTLTNLSIYRVLGGAGGAGAAGLYWGAAGGPGGDGGQASGIDLSGASTLAISGSRVEQLHGAAGGAGATGAIGLGTGGAAVALRIANASGGNVSDNSLTLVYGGAGAVGAIGGNGSGFYAGGQGGHGGSGGQSEGLLCDHCSQVTLTNNGFAGIHGAAGALGANGGLSLFGLASGGNGGNGGHGTGLHWRGVVGLNQGSSYGTINAGIGAWGGTVSGKAGANGLASSVKVD